MVFRFVFLIAVGRVVQRRRKGSLYLLARSKLIETSPNDSKLSLLIGTKTKTAGCAKLSTCALVKGGQHLFFVYTSHF